MAQNTALRKREKQANKKKKQTITEPFQDENKKQVVFLSKSEDYKDKC